MHRAVKGAVNDSDRTLDRLGTREPSLLSHDVTDSISYCWTSPLNQYYMIVLHGHLKLLL